MFGAVSHRGPFLSQHYLASAVIRPRTSPAMAAALRDVEAAALALDGSPPITRTTFPTCPPLPRRIKRVRVSIASPLMQPSPNGRRVGIRIVTFDASQASLMLRPAGLLSRLKRPLSRGSSPASYPAEPLVSYQINRQLSGWNPPPLVIRAFGAHCHEETSPPNRIRRTLWRRRILLNFSIELRLVTRASKQLPRRSAQSSPKKRRRVTSSQGHSGPMPMISRLRVRSATSRASADSRAAAATRLGW
jgi:hypothetical protein